jgi:Rhs element Vgr protein
LPISANHPEVTVKVNGQAVERERQLLAASVLKAVNKISSARLVYLDGSASASDFPLSNADTFAPGSEVEVLAGPSDDAASLFKGVVVRQSIRIRERTSPQLIVECRHAAFKLTVGRKNACFFDQKDSDAISEILGNAEVDATVEDTEVTHQQQVQFRSSDWDFLLARARANGKVVFTNDDQVEVKAAPTSGTAAATLQFGATLLELDAEIDARLQYSAVKSVTWDPAQQALVEKDATDPGINGPGNLAPGDLADVAALDAAQLCHAALDETEAQAWADAAWLRSRMSKVSGRVKCEGIGTINPGDFVTLSGVGERYAGDVLVTGVRHEADLVQGWKTHIQFGAIERWPADDPGTAPPRAALLPTVSGLQIGVVASNEDEDGEYRVRVRLPLVDNEGDGVWARVASPDAGDQRGLFFRPELGDEVVVGFLEDDPRRAVILGMLHSSAKPAPLEGSDDNHEKVYQSRSKMKLYFDDDHKVLQIETPAGNKITLSEEDKAVTIEDQNGNKIEMTEDGIKIESSKALELKAGTEIKLEASGSFEAKGSELKLEGSSTAELSSSSTTTVKGGMVKIN